MPIRRGDRVFVIGCGNTAIDAARTALRLEASEVTIIYHRTIEQMSALKAEYNDAVEEGVKFRWETSVKEILADDKGKVNGIVVTDPTGEYPSPPKR